MLGRTPFYAVSVNGLHRDKVRVSGRVRVSIRVRACRLDSSGNLLIRRKMEYAPSALYYYYYYYYYIKVQNKRTFVL